MPVKHVPSWRTVHIRRVIRVVVSCVCATAAMVGYVAGDVCDVLPGPLTLQAVPVRHIDTPLQAVSGEPIVASVDTGLPVDSARADAVISALLAAPGVGTDVSVAIADGTGQIVAQRELDTPREPASTLKTLTALAASATLDMGATLDTQTYLVQTGDVPVVIIKGNGDMLLSDGYNDASHVNGRAGLASLAQDTATALRQRGIAAVQVRYDDSLFGSTRAPANIERNNPGNLYYTGVSSMAIDGGRQWNGQRPSNPDVFEEYPTLSTTTAQDAAGVFVQRLRDQGIEVQGDATQETVPANTSPIAQVHSAMLSEILAFALRHSDNTLAEEFGRLTALAAGTDNSPSGAVQAVQAALAKLGISTDGLQMADCSGLSPGSQLTIRTLLDVQHHNVVADGQAAAAEGLSIPGVNGTAQYRITDEAAAGLLRVKTGSLDEVTSMTGNVSRRSGGVLTFAVIVNNPDDYAAAKQAVDTFITELVNL